MPTQANTKTTRRWHIYEQHVLSTADWDAFCKALDRPAKPNWALKEGFRWYQSKA